MARFLLTWELGGGLGHLTGLKPVAEELLRRGHEVHLALRDLTRVAFVFGDLKVRYWQAPIKEEPPRNAVEFPAAYVHLLHNCGFDNFEDLAKRAAAWRAIFVAVCPDVAVFDYSPTALLAARGSDCRRVVFGHGFFCPPTQPALPVLRTWDSLDLRAIAQDEREVLDRINRLLLLWQRPPLENLGELYGDVADTLLNTFEELDHFGPRPGTRYWGAWPYGWGERFQWPAGDGHRIFAYLKPSRALPALFQLLANWRFPTVIYADGLDNALVERFSSPTLRFSPRPVNMSQAAAECDLAILNANQASLAALLLAGKPSILLPPYLEQYLLSARLKQQGVSEFANPSNAVAVETGLRKMFDAPDYAAAAGRFAKKYTDYNPNSAVVELVTRLDSLAG